jgi:P27 family predicted phage terminase small subunit
MAKPGPKPQPTKLRLLRGNPGKRAVNKHEPKPRAEAPEAPAFLKREALEEWRRLAPELERLGLLTIVDGAALAAYCQAYQRWIQAERKVNREGLVLDAKSRYAQAHPAMAIAQRSMQIMRAFMAEFGLTPASRSRLSIEKPPEADPFEDYLHGSGDAN